MRDEAHRARNELAAIRSQLAGAVRAAQQAEQRAAKSERRAAKLVVRHRQAVIDARRARTARDEAQRLLRLKLSAARDLERFRGDPETLLAVIAEQRQLLMLYRVRLAQYDRDQRLVP